MQFPNLKTGAVAQYPLTTLDAFKNVGVTFLDGSTQRFRLQQSVTRKWIVMLDGIDEAELAALEAFLIAVHGRSEEFSFTDPETGTTYEHCVLDSDVNSIEWRSLSGGRSAIRIRQNGSQ